MTSIENIDYQKMYTLLFNAITDAVDQLEQFQPSKARTLLIRAQRAAEEIYISAQDESS